MPTVHPGKGFGVDKPPGVFFPRCTSPSIHICDLYMCHFSLMAAIPRHGGNCLIFFLACKHHPSFGRSLDASAHCKLWCIGNLSKSTQFQIDPFVYFLTTCPHEPLSGLHHGFSFSRCLCEVVTTNCSKLASLELLAVCVANTLQRAQCICSMHMMPQQAMQLTALIARKVLLESIL